MALYTIDLKDTSYTKIDYQDWGEAKALLGKGVEVENVETTTIDGEEALVISTKQGVTITVSGPELEKCQDIKPGDFLNAAINVGKLQETAQADIYILMALLHELGNEMKQSAREHRQAQRSLQMEKLQNAADKIRDAAAKARDAGIISGAFQIASGAAQITAGLINIIGCGCALKAGSEAKIMAATKLVGGISGAVEGIGKTGEGGGRIWSSFVTEQSEEDKAKQKEFESEATKADANIQKENEMMQDMRELIKKVQEMLQSMEQANHDTARTILRI
jgi:hypothetical protein